MEYKEIKPYYEKTFERHQKDLEDVASGKKPHLRFNKKLGLAYIKIIQQLKHYKGELAGQNIKLEEWQKKVIIIAFGWEKLNSKGRWVRRFNTVFIFIPRKNGKTILASAITIADSILRVEIGGEVIIFATKNKQAKLAWTGVEKMIETHPELKENSHNAYSVITLKKTDTTFSTLGRDSDTEDGSNPSIGIADEYHAHPDNSLYEVVESGQGARVQPLMLAITTSGFSLTSPAYNMYEHSKKVLEGSVEDDNFFAFIAEAPKQPEGDEYHDWYFREEVWKAANPNYGVSVEVDYMKKQAKQAQDRPETKNNFLVKNLNVWANAIDAYIPYDKWQQCKGELLIHPGIKYVFGFDLSVSDDFSALTKIWQINNKYYVDIKYYIPEDNIKEREKILRVPLLSWVNQGYITATKGMTVDYDYIYEDIKKDLENCDGILFDPYKAKQLVKRLEDNKFENLTPVRQGFISLTSPTKFLKDLVKRGDLVHDNNPCTNWQISNLIIATDAAGNIKPDKTEQNRKIDGPASLINALCHFEISQENTTSVYETRGLRAL